MTHLAHWVPKRTFLQGTLHLIAPQFSIGPSCGFRVVNLILEKRHLCRRPSQRLLTQHARSRATKATEVSAKAPWQSTVCWYLQNRIIPGSLGWCELDFATIHSMGKQTARAQALAFLTPAVGSAGAPCAPVPQPRLRAAGAAGAAGAGGAQLAAAAVAAAAVGRWGWWHSGQILIRAHAGSSDWLGARTAQDWVHVWKMKHLQARE